MQSYRFTSLPEYRALLSLYNIGVEEVSGEVRNKQYRGLVYSSLDSEGNKVGNPIKSSSIAKSVGHAVLTKRITSSGKAIKDKGLTERIKPILDTAIENYRNRQSFEKELLRNGISVVFRQNEEGRIYGATFIDHETRTVLNGSKIGKDYSANVFHNLFQNSRDDEPLQVAENTAHTEDATTMQPPLELNVTIAEQEPDNPDNTTENVSENKSRQSFDDTSFMPSLLEQHGEDYEAEAFARRKEAEAKRRKRRGRHM
jgi:hypothetical protein